MRTALKWMLVVTALVAPSTAAQTRLRVLISVDMEGVVGTVTGDQLGPTGFEYGRFREFMTREAVAASRRPGPPVRPTSSSPMPTATARTC